MNRLIYLYLKKLKWSLLGEGNHRWLRFGDIELIGETERTDLLIDVRDLTSFFIFLFFELQSKRPYSGHI